MLLLIAHSELNNNYCQQSHLYFSLKQYSEITVSLLGKKRDKEKNIIGLWLSVKDVSTTIYVHFKNIAPIIGLHFIK